VAPGRRLPRWLAPGDWNAFFGLALDNLTQLVILSGLLIGVFKFPADLVLGRMVPGTAAGGDDRRPRLHGARRPLMRRTGRDDVTAMPFGIDTPSLFGLVFGVLGPAMLLTGDPVLAVEDRHGRHRGHGWLKLVLAFGGDWVRRPRAPRGALGSIAGVAALLIAFLRPSRSSRILCVGITSLTIVLVALVGRVRLPGGLPGAFVGGGGGSGGLLDSRGDGSRTGAARRHPVALSLAIPWPTFAWVAGVRRDACLTCRSPRPSRWPQ
jgi:AGZA family xanthine/uracil permease-like MFS transporter